MYRVKESEVQVGLLVKILSEKRDMCRVEVMENKSCHEKGDRLYFHRDELEKVSCELPSKLI